jgi:hypothetical protein
MLKAMQQLDPKAPPPLLPRPPPGQIPPELLPVRAGPLEGLCEVWGVLIPLAMADADPELRGTLGPGRPVQLRRLVSYVPPSSPSPSPLAPAWPGPRPYPQPLAS